MIWNLWLIKRGERPVLYFAKLSEVEAMGYLAFSAAKAFDGSDADGFVLTRSDCPMPYIWPNK